MRKQIVVYIILSCLIILTSFICSAFAGTYTRYPYYDVGYAGGDGVKQVDATYQDYHYITLLNGTVKLFDSVAGSIIGAGAMAESYGYQGITWTCPGSSGGGGGCPYVSVWNGTQYVLDNNVLPTSRPCLGDVEDFYLLQQPLLNDGEYYKLQLSEFEHEHDFLDQVKLLSVDHPINVNVAVASDGEILTFKDPQPPVSAITNEHRNVKELLAETDENYYQGYNGSYIQLNFGDELNLSNGARLVLRTDSKCADICILVQVQNLTSAWNTVASTAPRRFWSTDIVDMTKISQMYWVM